MNAFNRWKCCQLRKSNRLASQFIFIISKKHKVTLCIKHVKHLNFRAEISKGADGRLKALTTTTLSGATADTFVGLTLIHSKQKILQHDAKCFRNVLKMLSKYQQTIYKGYVAWYFNCNINSALNFFPPPQLSAEFINVLFNNHQTLKFLNILN